MNITRYRPPDGDYYHDDSGFFVSYDDHVAAIAEAAEDYANLASTSGDLLKLAVARAEKAESDLEAYKARKTSINPWPWRNWRKK